MHIRTCVSYKGKECVLLCTSRHFGFCCWRLLTYGYAARRLENRPIHSPAVQSNLRTIFSLKFCQVVIIIIIVIVIIIIIIIIIMIIDLILFSYVYKLAMED